MVAAFQRTWLILTAAGGALLALGGLAELAVDEDSDRPLSSAMQDRALRLHLALNLTGYVLILAGLPGLALRLARRRAGLAVPASVLLSLGLTFMVGFGMFSVFVAPVLADGAPHVLDGDWTGSMAAMQAGFPMFFLGMAVFAGTVLWLGTLSRIAGGILLGAVVISAADVLIDGAVLGGIAFAWMAVDALMQPQEPVGQGVAATPAHRA